MGKKSKVKRANPIQYELMIKDSIVKNMRQYGMTMEQAADHFMMEWDRYQPFQHLKKLDAMKYIDQLKSKNLIIGNWPNQQNHNGGN